MSDSAPPLESARPTDFIRELVTEDLRAGNHGGRVHTRFPPEPNGYLHIGHAKSICLNFGVASEFRGLCNLRFDDTNPAKEDVEYVDSIQEDVRWLGFDWDDRLFYASDYFEQMYTLAERLIEGGHAYVDSLTADEIRQYRGTLTEPGRNSPHRARTGGREPGHVPAHARRASMPTARTCCAPRSTWRRPTSTCAIRRSIGSGGPRTTAPATPGASTRPTTTRTRSRTPSRASRTRSARSSSRTIGRCTTGWWITSAPRASPSGDPQQVEFARLNLNYTVMSKRKLLALVEQGLVAGWDDPRMPTIAGIRRRGYTPEAVRDFCSRIGVAKKENVIDVALLEHTVREDLNRRAARALAVLRPLKVVIENLPARLLPDRRRP